ncbi:hypothetical protein [Sporosarcina sp. FA9]|uniref:hypothetical protein n=1 Tax=Sporosarcina sp. FA9 TaxID=3413030 RepID=UPI003F65C912
MKYQVNNKFAISFNICEEIDGKPECFHFQSILARFSYPDVQGNHDYFMVNHEIYELVSNHFTIENFELGQMESMFTLVDSPTGMFEDLEGMDCAVIEKIESIQKRLQPIMHLCEIELVISGL